MGSKITVYLLFYVIILTISLTDAQNQNCYTTGNFTANSTYAKNRDLVLHSLASNVTANGGFYNTTIGSRNDTVYGLALCMSDPSAEDCSYCVNSAVQSLMVACPDQKEALSQGGNPRPCLVRYANRYFFGSLELDPTNAGYNTGLLETDLAQFGQIWSGLMADTIKRASSGSSRLKLGTGKADLTSTQKIYVFMQCTPDISQSNCSYCLQESVAYYRSCCYGQQGGYVHKPNCVLRWDLYPFYNLFPEVPSPSPAPAPSTPFIISSPSPTNTTIKKEKKNTASRTVVVTVIPTVIVLALVILSTLTIFRFRKPKKEVKTVSEIETAEFLQFKFSTIRAATDNFSEKKKLGQGGFGSVYEGTLSNGQKVAVKRLSKNSGQGDLEFKNEILLVAKLKHRNLVRLQGFCLQGIERLLIYEFLPNASLDHFIFNQARRSQLDWERRYKIISGIARGLLYLHEDSRLRIIHRDLKASNILLDSDMNPKIADFGMARLFVVDQSQANTSRIVGTYGYMAPEYAMHGQFSVKSDVFSFGVLILEIVSGQKNNCFRNGETVEDLLSYAWRNWREGTALNVVDPALSTGSRNEMMRSIHIGLLCVQEKVADRPTMASIVLMLNSYSITMPTPSQPAFFMNSCTYQSDLPSSMGYNSRVTESSEATDEALPFSANQASITELYPR